jgi:transcriptional pleiotropic repressor
LETSLCNVNELLKKTRNINRAMQMFAGQPVDFAAIAKVLGESVNANIYLVGRRGKILACQFCTDFTCSIMEDIIAYSESFPESYNHELLQVNESTTNLPQENDSCLYSSSSKCPLPDKKITIVPIIGGGERLGSLILTRVGSELDAGELVLAEYGAVSVGMEIMRIKQARAESDTRKKASVQIALSTLSFSEMEAVEHIFYELDGLEGLLVASRIADRVGITRSVIVNALRKLESAGVIESKSLGMKGTYIRVLNENLPDELKKNNSSRKSVKNLKKI